MTTYSKYRAAAVDYENARRVKAVRCPYCQADVGNVCRSRNGLPHSPHMARIRLAP